VVILGGRKPFVELSISRAAELFILLGFSPTFTCEKKKFENIIVIKLKKTDFIEV
jgi:hypothetical protein